MSIFDLLVKSVGHPSSLLNLVVFRSRCWRRDRRLQSLYEKVSRHTQGQVARGPFAGMIHLAGATGSAAVPKIAGTYEEEIQGWITAAIGEGYELVVDIGADEGYYAVGFARELKRSRVVAFEAYPKAREMCRRLAAANGVAGRVELKGWCDVPALRGVLRAGAFVLCDCEGGEDVLLDPTQIPVLAACDILVEAHDHEVVGVTQRLIDRFARTHDVQAVRSRARVVEDGSLAFLSGAERVLAVDEFRPAEQQWLLLRRKPAAEKAGKG